MKCFGGSEKRRSYHCKIVLLDETELIQEISDISKGQDLIEIVFKHLNLLETVYFGLRFIATNGQPCWLDSTKNIVKQVKNVNPLTFYFGVKFYASDPCKLLEEITRYQFFLQIKQDIFQSRLPVPSDLLAQLFAFSVQSELGDYDSRRHQAGYISEFRFVANQTSELEDKVSALHKTLSGQVPATAEMNFLEKVKWLDLYGADLHPVLGEDNVEYFLGLTPSGVIVLRNKSKVGNYFWPRIVKLYRKDKYFMLQVVEKSNESNTYGFELPTKQACKHLWKCCSEHQAFFRLTQNRDRLNGSAPGRLGGLTSRFRYSGRGTGSFNKDQLDRSFNGSRERPPSAIVRVPSRRYQRRLGQPDGADAPVYKENVGETEGHLTTATMTTTATGLTANGQSNIIVPPGRHITQPVIYRSTSVPNGVNSSPKSTRSAPWENPNQKGLFSSCGNVSPKSARNNIIHQRTSSIVSGQTSTSGYHHHNNNHHHHHHHSRRDSASSINRSGERSYSKSSRASDNESEVSRCSKSSRHSHHSARSSSSHHHHHHHHHRCKSSSSRRSGDESGNESDSSRKRHRRRRKCCSEVNFTMVDSEQQWKEIQRRQLESGEVVPQTNAVRPQTAAIRDYRVAPAGGNGNYQNSGLESEIEVMVDGNSVANRSRNKKSADGSRSHRELMPQEVKRHIDYDLVIPTEEDKRNINYTKVETDNSRLFKIRYSPNSGRARYKLEKIHVKQGSASSDSKSDENQGHYSGHLMPAAQSQYQTPRSVLKPSNSNNISNSSGYADHNESLNNYEHYQEARPIDSNVYGQPRLTVNNPGLPSYQQNYQNNQQTYQQNYQQNYQQHPTINNSDNLYGNYSQHHQQRSQYLVDHTPQSSNGHTLNGTRIPSERSDNYQYSQNEEIPVRYNMESYDIYQSSKAQNNQEYLYDQPTYQTPRVTFQSPPSTTSYFINHVNPSPKITNGYPLKNNPLTLHEMSTEL